MAWRGEFDFELDEPTDCEYCGRDTGNIDDVCSDCNGCAECCCCRESLYDGERSQPGYPG